MSHFLGVRRSKMGVTSRSARWHYILVYCGVCYTLLNVWIIDIALGYANANEFWDTISTELSKLFKDQEDIWRDNLSWAE